MLINMEKMTDLWKIWKFLSRVRSLHPVVDKILVEAIEPLE